MKLTLFQTSITASVFIIAIIIIRALLLNKLPKTTFIVLWVIAVARLLVPFSLPTLLSVYRHAPLAQNQAPVFSGFYTMQYSFFGEYSATQEATRSYLSPAGIVWAIGALAVLTYFAAVSIKNRREMRSCLPVENKPFVTEWLGRQKLYRPLSVRQSSKITTPVTTGILRPQIILPAGWQPGSQTQLEYVLTHEYFHIKRMDALWKLLAAIALCIHWFNPLAWVLFILLCRDLELACDVRVLRHFGDDAKTAYAYSIIELAQEKNKLMPFYSGFSKNAAEERIVSIMKTKKITITGIVISALLVICATSAFAAGPFDEPTRQSDIGDASCRPMTVEEQKDFAEIEKEWESFGLISKDEFECFYNGQPVQFFIDNHSGTSWKFAGTVLDCGRDTCEKPGSLLLEAVRNSNGKLVEIKEITPEEANKLAKWR